MKNILNLFKAIVLCLLSSLAFVLLFSFVVGIFSLDVSVIKPVNQVFKIVCVALGGIVFLKGEKGLLWGTLYGVLAIFLCYVIYGAMSGGVVFTPFVFLELLLGAVAGAISGVIGVNIHKNSVR